VLGATLGALGLVRGRRGALAMLLVGAARLLLQLPADATLLLLARVVSALQALLGIEPPGRRLDDAELGLLARIFGRGIDPLPVRAKVGRLGLLGLPRRAFVVGDTLHVPELPPRLSLATSSPALLVHELTHVWQHQRHGTRYLSECLLAQWLGDGYNVAVAVEAGRRFAELNFEQQAELLERAFAAGWFAEETGSEGRLLLRLVDARRDDGFLVELAPPAVADAMAASGWCDITPLLAEGLAAVREQPRGRGEAR
jgi:hypothetical protein